MAFGFEIYNEDGHLVISQGGNIGRVIGFSQISFSQNQLGNKSTTIPGLISTDQIFIQDSGNLLVIYSVSRSGQTVTINRAGALAGDPSTHLICGVRF